MISIPSANPCRRGVAVWAALLATSVAAALPTPDELTLARCVPPETGLYVELRRSEDVLVALTDPQLWTALADFAGQPAGPEETSLWRARIKAAIDMEPAEAIHTLFDGGVAFVGEGPLRSQDAIVLCRPRPDLAPAELLERWQAEPRTDTSGVATYLLNSGVALATHDDILMFGNAGAPRGMFRRVTQFVANADRQTLADDPTYQQLLQRVPPDPDGVLFVRLQQGRAPVIVPPLPLTTQPTTQPGLMIEPALPDLPGPFRGASNVMLALHREGRTLHLTAVGDARNGRRSSSRALLPLVKSLPAETLLAWGGHIDYTALVQTLDALPARNLARLMLRPAGRLPETLDSPAVLAVGAVPPTNGPPQTPALPALAVLVTTRDPGAVADIMDNLAITATSIYNLLAASQGGSRLPAIEELRVGDARVHRVDLTDVVQPFTDGIIPEAHLCWTLDNDVLIVTTHLDWMRQILAARAGHGADLSGALASGKRPADPRTETVVIIRTGATAQLGARWLQHLQRVKPDVLQERWWRARQPGGGSVRLGVNVAATETPRQLRVVSVTDGTPADGLLEAEDLILGYEGHAFTTDDTIAEIKRALVERPNARWVDLVIERAGQRQLVRVPLPFVDPTRVLRRVTALGRVVERIVYSDDVPDAAGPRGYLMIELSEMATSAPAPLATPAPDTP